MSPAESQHEWTRLVRARGPRVIYVRVSAIWLGAFAGLFLAGGIARGDTASALVAASFLAAALVVLFRAWAAGLFTDGTFWELRGVLGRTRIRRSSITAVGLADTWGLGGPIRMLCVDQRVGDQVTFPLISWGNQMRSLHYGAGLSEDESPRQARTLDALRGALLDTDHEQPTS